MDKIGFYTLSNERVRSASAYSKMQRCEMIITEYCNFSCPYCNGLDVSIYGDRRIKQLSLSEIKSNIDLWSPLENIRFSGGEPTLHRNIREVVSYSKDRGVKRIAISTNGSNKTPLYKELIDLGANDFSISLDACCADDGDQMAGVSGSFDTVVKNIRFCSERTYVTVGIVLTPENVQKTIDTIYFADSLGVADIRVISAAQWNQPIEALGNIRQDVLDRHPILKYRVNNFKNGINVRGIKKTDSPKCGLVLDDSVIAGDFHFPCVIYMREKGLPIGKVGPGMRKERVEWLDNHNSYTDPICRSSCLDVCIHYNNEYRKYNPMIKGNGKRRLPIIK